MKPVFLSSEFSLKKNAHKLSVILNNEVLNQITSLKNKAEGMITFNHFFLKAADTLLHRISVYVSILYLQKEFFPKIARITPIYKSGAKEEINNYRRIPILTCFSKNVEKVLYARLISFFLKHNVI